MFYLWKWDQWYIFKNNLKFSFSLLAKTFFGIICPYRKKLFLLYFPSLSFPFWVGLRGYQVTRHAFISIITSSGKNGSFILKFKTSFVRLNSIHDFQLPRYGRAIMYECHGFKITSFFYPFGHLNWVIRGHEAWVRRRGNQIRTRSLSHLHRRFLAFQFHARRLLFAYERKGYLVESFNGF